MFMSDFIHTVCPKCLELIQVNFVDAEIDGASCDRCCGDVLLDGAIIEANDEVLKELIKKSPYPVIVDFYASWCAPCKDFLPIFSSVAYCFYKHYTFVKISAEFNPVMAQSLNIKGIPHTVIFKNGQEVARKVGGPSEKNLTKWIMKSLKQEL